MLAAVADVPQIAGSEALEIKLLSDGETRLLCTQAS
jgi:hypothetical protein